eukprot:gene10452-10611_t
MAQAGWPGFAGEGCLWFTNLTWPAVVFAEGGMQLPMGPEGLLLPLSVTCIMLCSIRLGFKATGTAARHPSLAGTWWSTALACLPGVLYSLVLASTYLKLLMPQAALLHWLTSSSYTLALQLGLKSPTVRRLLGYSTNVGGQPQSSVVDPTVAAQAAAIDNANVLVVMAAKHAAGQRYNEALHMLNRALQLDAVNHRGAESAYSGEPGYGVEGYNGYNGGGAEGGYDGYGDGGHGGSKGHGGRLGGPYAYLGSHGLPEIEEHGKPFWKTSDNVDKYPDVDGHFHAHKPGPWQPLVITKPEFIKDVYAEKPEKEVIEKKPKYQEPPVQDITEKLDIPYPGVEKPIFIKDIYAVKPEKEVREKKPKYHEPPVMDITEKPDIDYPGIQKPEFEKDVYAEKPFKPVYEKKPQYKEEPVPDLSEDTKHLYPKGHRAIQKGGYGGGHAGGEGGYQQGGYKQGGEGSYQQYDAHPMV